MTRPSGKTTASLWTLPTAAALEPHWRELEHRADASFFQSWHWIGTWVDCLPTGTAAELIRVERGSAVVGLGILIRRTVVRHRILRSRALFLNCTGDPRLDEITIEYNGFLAERGAEAEVARACIGFLLAERADWDELFLDGMRGPELLDGSSVERASVIEVSRRLCHYVDLAALRANGRDYVAVLGRGTRYNIRSSLREYEKRGTLVIEEATDLVQAHSYLQRLRHFHQRYWEQKGETGSFANDFFVTFHDRLIECAFADGVIQMLRVTAGEAEVGYLYNFVHAGHVYNYTGGFNYEASARRNEPGFVCHAYAVEHNRARGNATYDFMAGDSQYKRNLSTASHTLAWQVVQRPRLKLRIENLLRRVRRRGSLTPTA